VDPDQALRDLQDALRRGDIADARRAFSALDDWLLWGGFLPVRWHLSTAPRGA
jgi:hypothetical protein